MADQIIVRLFRCRPLRVEFDSVLRDRMMPDLVRTPGVVDVHVGRLRKKLEQAEVSEVLIETARGFGYRLIERAN